MKRITATIKGIFQNKFFIASALIIFLAAGIIAAASYLRKQNTENSARVEIKVKPDSLNKSLPCNRYYNEVLMY